MYAADIHPSLKCNTTFLQSGATHTLFNDSDTESDTEHANHIPAPTTSNVQPESEPKKSVEVNSVPQNTRRNRKRRNRRKARKLEQIQKPVGGEDDVLVAVSKVFENPTDSEHESCIETNKTGEGETSINTDKENQLSVEVEDTGDDFGVDFAADFDSYPELSGVPRVGDVLVYKVINITAPIYTNHARHF